ncbi:MAG TPA: chemotaxis protein CheB [Planctomycetaceae bacterium]|nr:chemotaxis protein CheB [Planctomycetaceae bacterium]
MAKKIRKGSSTEQSAEPDDTATQVQIPIVGVGMSAGGLEACKKFLTAMPVDSGVAIVLVPHLDPTHESLMATLLARQTKIPVREVEDGMKVRPNNVYVIPPNKCLSIRNGVLHLSDPPAVHRFETAIDIFLISLARDQREHAIGIVLSGTGTSGSQGLKEIKQAGGMVIAQLPESAQFNQMPLSAIATGLMDSVLPPEEMPAEIIRYVQAPWLRRDLEDDGVTPIELNDILTLLQAQTKYQFHCYRRNMVRRRVQRRMGIRQIKEFADYLKYLRQNPEEMQLLCKDLLISVTAFFRDPAAFLDLETKVIPTLIQSQQLKITQQQSGIASDTLSRDTENTLRTWVPACATGEEAYSIAMLLTERYTAEKLPCSFQLFATDLNENSLDFARQGIYPESALANISEDRLKQFFVRTGEHHFQVNKMLRGSVVFACHNLLADAPFSKLDLVVCRNLLIYLEPEVQQKVIALFHFSLRQDGYLMLGGSETIGRAVDLFEPVSKKSRIYHRTGPRRHDLLELPIAVSDKLKDTTSNPPGFASATGGFR